MARATSYPSISGIPALQQNDICVVFMKQCREQFCRPVQHASRLLKNPTAFAGSPPHPDCRRRRGRDGHTATPFRAMRWRNRAPDRRILEDGQQTAAHTRHHRAGSLNRATVHFRQVLRQRKFDAQPSGLFSHD